MIFPLTLNGYFRLSSYVLLATSFAMLWATGQLDWLSIVGYTAALATGWMIDREAWPPVLSRRAVNLLRIGYLLVLVVDWRIIGTPPALVVIHFVLFVSACKLLERKTTRDWLWLYLVAFFELLLAAGMTVGATFLFLLVVFLFAAISTLVSFEIRRASEQFASAIPPSASGAVELWREGRAAGKPAILPRGGAIASFSAVALAVILLLAAPLFMAMPRLTRASLGGRLLRTETLTGFSNTVRLGEVGRVKVNPQVVMRVRVKFPPGQEGTALRWRGVSFDNYDGQSWTLSDDTMQPVRRYGDSFQVEQALQARLLTEQTFYLEPLNLATIFAAPRVIWVRDLPTLERDSGEGLWTQGQPSQRLGYTVYSTTWTPSEADLIADSSRIYPPEIRRRYLQLPPHDPRIDELAAEVSAGAATPLQIARRIESHLQNSYGYTLNLRRTDESDPVADFLFNVRAGHCEYFASAMVLMLRSRRIPARLVNGFQMGEYSDVTGVYTVRQSDAHSWVEVYFPGHNWVAFDPTPSAGLSTYDNGLLAQMRQYFEAFELFWQDKVVGFGTNDQIAIFGALQKTLAEYQHNSVQRWFSWTSGLSELFGSWRKGNSRKEESGDLQIDSQYIQSIAIVALLLTAAIALIIWWRRRESWRWQMRRDQARSAIVFYQEMISALERAGHRRTPDATPREFASTLKWPEVDELTRFYERARYSRGSLTEDEVARIGALLGEIRLATKRRDLAFWRRRR
jgi:transglutaminase-like putative cysteine protease